MQETLRNQNFCISCEYEWFPRGHDISEKCPSCGQDICIKVAFKKKLNNSFSRNEMIKKIKELDHLTKDELIVHLGYFKKKGDGTIKIKYVEFYADLFKAKREEDLRRVEWERQQG